MTMIAARTAQAGLAAYIWNRMRDEFGPDTATRILREAVENDAAAGGRTFAALAPQGPDLEHFSTVLERWQAGDALRIADVVLTATSLSFTVTRCAYAEAYRDMGLSPDLGHALSCARDEPFAKGYSNRLTMNRTSTIMGGDTCCRFTFTWS